MNVRKILFITLAFLTLMLVAIQSLWLFVLPDFVNKQLSEDTLKNELYNKTGLKLSYENAKIITFWNLDLGLRAENVKLNDKKGTEILSLKNFGASIRTPLILLKKINLKNIETEDFYFIFSRDKNNKFFVGTYELSQNVKDFDININKLYAVAKNTKIVFDDKLLAKKITADIKNTDLVYEKHKRMNSTLEAEIFINDKVKSEISLDYKSKLPLKKSFKENNFVIDGFVKNLDLSDYSPYISYFGKKDLKALSGVINAGFKTAKNLNVKASLAGFNVDMKNPLDSIKSDSTIYLDSSISFNNKELKFEKTDVNAKNWAFSVSGSIKNYAAGKPNFDLTIDVPNADIHSLYWLSPSIEGDEQEVIQKFKKYGAWGNFKGTLKVNGEADSSGLVPEVTGDAVISDVYIVKNNPIVPHTKVFLSFMKNKVKVTTRVFAGYGEYVDVDGIAELKVEGAGDFHISSSKNVDLATVKYMLVPIHEVVGFDLGPVPYMGLDGKGNIDIFTKGSVTDGEVSGEFNFKNTTASLDGLNLKLEKAGGKLVFDRKKLHFYTTSALLKNQSLKVDGKADLTGNIDFDVTSSSIETGDLVDILKTSPMLADKKSVVEKIEKVSGKSDTKIKIKGLITDFEEILNAKDLEISGNLLFKDNSVKLKDSPVLVKGLNGSASFKTKNDFLEFSSDLTGRFMNSIVVMTAKYKTADKTNGSDFDFKKLSAQGYLKPFSDVPKQNYPLNVRIKSGRFKIENGDAQLSDFSAKFYDSDIFANAKIKDIFSKNPVFSYELNMSNFDLSNFNSLKKVRILPSYVQKVLNAYENYEGSANVSVNCLSNILRGTVTLKDVKFNHSFYKTPVSIDSGNLILNGERIILKSMVANVDNTPIFINASVYDLDKTMHFSGYFTTKLTDSFTNKYINSRLTYPIKPKGDITVTSDINGTFESFTIKPKIKFAQDADIYYMGANLGDEDDIRELIANITVSGNTYYIKKADYVRYMTSQNDKTYPLTILTANGIVAVSEKNVFVRNLNLETLNNANVKMFNVIFKKSVLKNGMFNCRLNIKGDVNNPKILGHLSMTNLDMPLYETNLKNIAVRFKEKLVEIKADGSAYDSDFSVKASIQNSLKPPYVVENLKLESNEINLDTMFDSLTRIPTPNTAMRPGYQSESAAKIPFDISDLVIKEGSISAKDMIIRGLSASNYVSDFSLGKDMILHFDRLAFDVTTGRIIGTASYNFADSRIKAEVNAYNVDANKVASSLFEFKDQLFGKANGSLVMTTKGSSENERLKNLSGYVYFDVIDGKMPKLGSVEYLLKAGNFIKSGITGASLSNLLDLIAPIKTGHFSSIKGRLALRNGVAQDIEVYSKGDNLNLYINGEYDILQQYANMKIFGRLTKKAANILGPVGNVSLNSILNAIPGVKLDNEDRIKILKDINKIPGVELSDQKYRVFTAKIDGKINEEKFVKSFRWIE